MKQHLQKMLAAAAGVLPEAVAGGGAAAVAYGASLMYQPAGWIVGGVFGIAAGVLMARGVK